MTDILTPTIRLTEPTPGGDSGTWATLLNSDMAYIDEAINQSITVSIADVNVVLIADGTVSDQARYLRYNFTGALTADRTVTLPANVKVGWASNNTTGGHNVILSAGGLTISLADSSWTFFNCDGSNVITQTVRFGAVEVAGTLSVTGIATLSAALQMPNNTAIQMKDSGGTYRNVVFVDNLNNTNIESAATGIRFLNQANSLALLTCLNNGLITTSASITSGTGYGSRQGSSGGTSGNLFNVYWNGAGAFLYIDSTNLGQFSFASDRRVKHSIENTQADALARVMSLRPVTYRFADVGIFKDDGRSRVGFVADEVGAVVPSAVEGSPDAVDENGNPLIQTINPIPLIAELTAAIQELSARLMALEARP